MGRGYMAAFTWTLAIVALWRLVIVAKSKLRALACLGWCTMTYSVGCVAAGCSVYALWYSLCGVVFLYEGCLLPLATGDRDFYTHRSSRRVFGSVVGVALVSPFSASDPSFHAPTAMMQLLAGIPLLLMVSAGSTWLSYATFYHGLLVARVERIKMVERMSVDARTGLTEIHRLGTVKEKHVTYEFQPSRLVVLICMTGYLLWLWRSEYARVRNQRVERQRRAREVEEELRRAAEQREEAQHQERIERAEAEAATARGGARPPTRHRRADVRAGTNSTKRRPVYEYTAQPPQSSARRSGHSSFQAYGPSRTPHSRPAAERAGYAYAAYGTRKSAPGLRRDEMPFERPQERAAMPSQPKSLGDGGTWIDMQAILDSVQAEVDKVKVVRDEEQRRKEFKDLLLRHHPDKHPPYLKQVYEEITKVLTSQKQGVLSGR
mmetsp:Transcript_15026/g.28863  ORF Transcript_15026/g.28863 Transcript_15026/m.28863 type:complete len:434 (+) Transcript_15026:66-1367(+)